MLFHHISCPTETRVGRKPSETDSIKFKISSKTSRFILFFLFFFFVSFLNRYIIELVNNPLIHNLLISLNDVALKGKNWFLEQQLLPLKVYADSDAFTRT